MNKINIELNYENAWHIEHTAQTKKLQRVVDKLIKGREDRSALNGLGFKSMQNLWDYFRLENIAYSIGGGYTVTGAIDIFYSFEEEIIRCIAKYEPILLEKYVDKDNVNKQLKKEMKLRILKNNNPDYYYISGHHYYTYYSSEEGYKRKEAEYK